MSVTTRFLAPDLTQLQPAALIETIDSEAILAAQKAWILARWDAIRVDRPDLPALDTLGLETEPLTILLEVFAYRETLLRALVNDKARAVLIAYATGSDLDHLAQHVKDNQGKESSTGYYVTAHGEKTGKRMGKPYIYPSPSVERIEIPRFPQTVMLNKLGLLED